MAPPLLDLAWRRNVLAPLRVVAVTNPAATFPRGGSWELVCGCEPAEWRPLQVSGCALWAGLHATPAMFVCSVGGRRRLTCGGFVPRPKHSALGCAKFPQTAFFFRSPVFLHLFCTNTTVLSDLATGCWLRLPWSWRPVKRSRSRLARAARHSVQRAAQHEQAAPAQQQGRPVRAAPPRRLYSNTHTRAGSSSKAWDGHDEDRPTPTSTLLAVNE